MRSAINISAAANTVLSVYTSVMIACDQNSGAVASAAAPSVAPPMR